MFTRLSKSESESSRSSSSSKESSSESFEVELSGSSSEESSEELSEPIIKIMEKYQEDLKRYFDNYEDIEKFIDEKVGRLEKKYSSLKDRSNMWEPDEKFNFFTLSDTKVYQQDIKDRISKIIYIKNNTDVINKIHNYIILRFINNVNKIDLKPVLLDAVKSGDVLMAEFLSIKKEGLVKECSKELSLCCNAVLNGHEEMVEWLYDKKAVYYPLSKIDGIDKIYINELWDSIKLTEAFEKQGKKVLSALLKLEWLYRSGDKVIANLIIQFWDQFIFDRIISFVHTISSFDTLKETENYIIDKTLNFSKEYDYIDNELMQVSAYGHFEVVKKLLEEYGADASYVYEQEKYHCEQYDEDSEKSHDKHESNEISGVSALTLAVSSGHTKIVELLIDHGANLNVVDRFGVNLLEESIKKDYLDIFKILLDKPEFKGDIQDYFKIALKNHSYEIAKFLLEEKEVNVNFKNGKTALHMLFGGYREIKNLQIIDLILDNGCGINSICSKYNSTALHHACDVLDIEAAKHLIEKGADITIADNEGDTLLHMACLRGKIELVNILIEGGANIEALNNKGRTPLMNAIMLGRLDCAKVLIENGAEINISDESGLPLLFYIVRDVTSSRYGDLLISYDYKRYGLLTLLVDNKVDLNTKNKNGTTILKCFYSEVIEKKYSTHYNWHLTNTNYVKHIFDISKTIVEEFGNDLSNQSKNDLICFIDKSIKQQNDLYNKYNSYVGSYKESCNYYKEYESVCFESYKELVEMIKKTLITEGQISVAI